MTLRSYHHALPDPVMAAVVGRFREELGHHAEFLVRDACRLGCTPIKHHRQDVAHVQASLVMLQAPRHPPGACVWRSRGRVLLGLSGNEPLAISILPACGALLAGNTLLLRPATRMRAIADLVAHLLRSCGMPADRLEMVGSTKAAIDDALHRADHVAWIGSSPVCREVAHAALTSGCSVAVEAEGFDVAVIDETVAADAVSRAADWIVQSATRHDGQTCQAIHAVLVHRSHALRARTALQEAVARLRMGPADDEATDITRPVHLVRADHLVYPEQAPFSSSIAVVEYVVEEEMRHALERNPFGLSGVFFTARSMASVLEGPARALRTGRVLVNAPPAVIPPGAPWGGYRRSGSAGPRDLVEAFADVVFLEEGAAPSPAG